jgi:hypothetical protein
VYSGLHGAPALRLALPPDATGRALSQNCLLEAKSENGVLKNQPLAQIHFPVFGDL